LGSSVFRGYAVQIHWTLLWTGASIRRAWQATWLPWPPCSG